jgi:hypothetical protein
MNWKFVIKTGHVYDPLGNKVWTGYAGGNEGKNPEGVNNPLAVTQSKIGPLPPGFYTMEEPVLQSHLGPFAIPLTPDATNVMFGRRGFYCHGDHTNPPARSASEGCIIALRAVRNDMWNKHYNGQLVHRIQVVAEE